MEMPFSTIWEMFVAKNCPVHPVPTMMGVYLDVSEFVHSQLAILINGHVNTSLILNVGWSDVSRFLEC